MEKNNHIQVIEKLIERNKNLEIAMHRMINGKKRESMYCKKKLKNYPPTKTKTLDIPSKTKQSDYSYNPTSTYLKTPTSQKKLASASNPKELLQFYTDEKTAKDPKALEIEKDMTKYAIQKMLSNIQENSKEVIRYKSTSKKQHSKKSKKTKKIRRSPEQLFNDLNRQSYTIKIKKYKNPKLVPEAIKLPQSEVETLEHREVQTPISMKYGDNKILNSKFEFYRTFINSNLKRRLFNQWLSKWSRKEIKKLRNDLRKAIDTAKDDIEEKKRFSRDYVPDSVFYSNKKKNSDEDEQKQDTPVNMDVYNENFLKEDIFIDPKEEEKKRNEKFQPVVDFYIGGE